MTSKAGRPRLSVEHLIFATPPILIVGLIVWAMIETQTSPEARLARAQTRADQAIRSAADDPAAAEQALIRLRDETNGQTRAVFADALTQLNASYVEARAEELAQQARRAIGAAGSRSGGAALDEVERVDLVILLRRDDADGALNLDNEREPVPQLKGLARTEIDALLADVRLIGVEARRARVVGYYDNCPQGARNEAYQEYLTIYVIDLETLRVERSLELEGGPPPDTITRDAAISYCSQSGSAPYWRGRFESPRSETPN